MKVLKKLPPGMIVIDQAPEIDKLPEGTFNEMPLSVDGIVFHLADFQDRRNAYPCIAIQPLIEILGISVEEIDLSHASKSIQRAIVNAPIDPANPQTYIRLLQAPALIKWLCCEREDMKLIVRRLCRMLSHECLTYWQKEALTQKIMHANAEAAIKVIERAYGL